MFTDVALLNDCTPTQTSVPSVVAVLSIMKVFTLLTVNIYVS